MMFKYRLTLGLMMSFTGCAYSAQRQPAIKTEPRPKLILQITVDQLRGDLPERFVKHMGEGGFRYLMDEGIWYADANYTHANTETIVGHACLATGADPAVHGMIGNTWLRARRERGALFRCRVSAQRWCRAHVDPSGARRAP